MTQGTNTALEFPLQCPQFPANRVRINLAAQLEESRRRIAEMDSLLSRFRAVMAGSPQLAAKAAEDEGKT